MAQKNSAQGSQQAGAHDPPVMPSLLHRCMLRTAARLLAVSCMRVSTCCNAVNGAGASKAHSQASRLENNPGLRDRLLMWVAINTLRSCCCLSQGS